MAWLRRGAAAATLAGDRADLWPAGMLASLAYLGWLPLLLAVAPPNAADLQALGVSLYTSGAYPANVIALSVALVSGFVLLCLAVAVAEAVLRGSLTNPIRRGEDRGTGERALSALAVILLAAVPAAAAFALVATAVAINAPAEFTSPNVDTAILVRLAAAVWPYLAVLAAALVVGQLFGGLALHHALAPGSAGAGSGLLLAFRHLARRPWAPVGIALAGGTKDVAYLVVSYALLRVLWAPIGAGVGPGFLSSPGTLLLLLGFVAIWLVLLVGGGALHVVVSAWWASELGTAASEARPPEVDAQPRAQGGDAA